ncbi:hypothetical protein FSP39_004098 [Pinctada imbricata]|uniref:Ion transport domain-containing protein n=1 Tax=Pinctada imbricata TaxID=66713 RepID=A0AA89BSI9_PINIB|nr:hypothetical protein FSP39_004098 [Pinctada imbricata]
MIVAFSALVMTSIDDNFYKRSIARVWEYYIYVWAAGDFIEEIRNGMGIFTTGGKSHRGYRSRAKRYLNDFWNAMDLLSYILLILAMLTRHLWESHPYTLARRMFAVSLLSMYLRILQMFLMNRILGPTLIMIKEMLKDLSYFLLLALVAIIGVGIYYHANLYPNHINLIGPGTWDTWHIWKILYYPYWQLYGESFSEFLEVQEQSNCTSDPSVYEVSADLDRCAEKDPTVPIVSGIYMLISNLLLVNLVIAMFSYTFDTVMANSEKLWRFQRYTVITDYEGKVPSPINFIIRPIQLYRFVSKKCKCKTESDNESWITVRGDTGGVSEIVIDAFQDYFCKEYFDVKGKYTGKITKSENKQPINLPIKLMRLGTEGNVINPRLLGFASKSKQEKKLYYEISIFDVDNDDPLILSKIIGEAIVRTWAMENAHKGNDLYYEKTMKAEDITDAEGKTISDILLWSIFANRPDLSQVLWLATDNHLMTGLVCTALLKKIAKKASNVKEEVLSRSLNEHAKLFSDRCLEMLTEMYDQNAKAAMKIVDSEVKIWGIFSTPMTFAYENYEMDFIAHTCPQRRLNRIWYNKLAPDFKIFLKV